MHSAQTRRGRLERALEFGQGLLRGLWDDDEAIRPNAVGRSLVFPVDVRALDIDGRERFVARVGWDKDARYEVLPEYLVEDPPRKRHTRPADWIFALDRSFEEEEAELEAARSRELHKEGLKRVLGSMKTRRAKN